MELSDETAPGAPDPADTPAAADTPVAPDVPDAADAADAADHDAGPHCRRGRPRSEAAERAILDCVRTLIGEGIPLTEISIERIARTAGVGKATIYRRWDGKEALLVDVLRDASPPEPPLPGTSLREDMVALVENIRLRGVAGRASVHLQAVVGQMKSYPKLWRAYQSTVVEPRRRLALDILRRAVERGELRPDIEVEVMNDLVVGPMLVRTLLREDASLDEELTGIMVDVVLRGLGPLETDTEPGTPGRPD